MAELLVKAVDAVHADPDVDRAGCYKKGDVVVAFGDGHEWGAGEAPPKFVIVKCPELDLATARTRIESWDYVYDFTILARDVSLDGWRFKVTNPNRRASDGAATPKLSAVQSFFQRWGATYVRTDPDGIVLDWRIVDGAISESFLGADPASVGAAITEAAYDETSGVHTFALTWDSDLQLVPGTLAKRQEQARQRITSLGGTIMSEVGLTMTYTLPRDRVRDAFVEEVQSARAAYKRRRYSFSSSDVDTALGMGGVVTLALAQLTAHVIDHMSL